MEGEIILDVEMPGELPHCLWPNVRCHHMQKYREMKWARTNAWLAALEAGAPKQPTGPFAMQWEITLGKGHKQRDIDNTIGAMKALQDGIFDAMGVDDGNVVQVGVTWKRSLTFSVRCRVIALTHG